MRLERVNRLSRFFAELSGWLIVPMMLTVFLDAVLRGLFNTAVAGVIELNSLLLVAMVYLGLAGAQSGGGNFRVTLLTDRMGRRIRHIVTAVGYLLLLATLAILLWYCFGAAMYSYSRDEVSYGLINFPLWPSRALICVGLLLLLVQYLVDGVLFFVHGADPFSRNTPQLDDDAQSSMEVK